MWKVLPLVTAFVIAGTVVDASSGGSARLLHEGESRAYAASSVAKGQAFVCVVGAIRATARVPARGRSVIVFADGMRDSATLRLRRKTNGSLVATCQ